MTWTLAALTVAIVILAWFVCGGLDAIWTRKKGSDARTVPGQPLSSFQRAIRREDRRPLSERVAADLRERGHATCTVREVLRFNHDERGDWPIAESADRPKPAAHRPRTAVGVDGNSCFATTSLSTSVTRGPENAA